MSVILAFTFIIANMMYETLACLPFTPVVNLPSLYDMGKTYSFLVWNIECTVVEGTGWQIGFFPCVFTEPFQIICHEHAIHVSLLTFSISSACSWQPNQFSIYDSDYLYICTVTVLVENIFSFKCGGK